MGGPPAGVRALGVGAGRAGGAGGQQRGGDREGGMMTRNIDCAWTGELCEEGECLKGKICILSARDRAAWAEPQAAWQAAKPLKPDCRLSRNPATGRRELWVFN